MALLASLFWGGNVVALKISLVSFGPLWAAWWRFALGVLALAAWAGIQRVRLRPDRREVRPLLIIGVLFAAQILLLNIGVSFTSPGYAVVMINAHPLFSNLIGHFLASEERLSPARITGLAIAFAGVCYLALGQPVEELASNPLLGNWLIIISAFLLGIRTVYTRLVVQSIDPMKSVVWQTGFALPFFLAPALLLEAPLTGPLTTKAVVALLYQGAVVSSVSFIIWFLLLKRHAAGSIAVFAFLIPFEGIALSALFFGEPVTGRMVLAAAMSTLGIAIVTRSQGR